MYDGWKGGVQEIYFSVLRDFYFIHFKACLLKAICNQYSEYAFLRGCLASTYLEIIKSFYFITSCSTIVCASVFGNYWQSVAGYLKIIWDWLDIGLKKMKNSNVFIFIYQKYMNDDAHLIDFVLFEDYFPSAEMTLP